MKFLVFPSAFAVGLDPENPRACVPGRVVDLDTAWAPSPRDIHAVGYAPTNGDQVCPRLCKGQEDWADENQVMLSWLCYDIDNPDHQPWSNPEAAEVSLAHAFNVLPSEIADYAGGYTTRAGLRLVFHLANPVPVRYGDALLRALGERLADLGLAVDPQCYQWTRLYRMPRATRDGDLLHSETDAPESIPGSVFELLHLEPSEVSCATAVDADMPESPLDVPDWVYTRGCLRFPEVPRGEPFDPDDGGSIFRTVRTALASVAANAGITQPELLISVVWRSIEASGRTPDEFFGLACWVCGQQAAQQADLVSMPEFPTSPPEKVYPPSDKWWDAVRRMAKSTGKVTPPQVVAAFRRGKTVDIERTSFRKAAQILCDLVSGTPYAETPEKVYAALHSSYGLTPNCRCDTADLWEWAVDAARDSWEARVTTVKSERERHSYEELREAWPPLLCTGKEYWVLDPRDGPGNWTYRPSDSGTAVAMVRKFQADLPVDILARTSTDKGSLISTTVALDKMGSFVDSVSYKSGIQCAKFRESGRHLLLPCHRRSEVQPRESKLVDGWLRVFAGEQYDRLVKWISAVPKTAQGPLSALYLEGPPGCGKSLLCKGLSALWDDAPVDYNRIASSEFTGELLTSPLLIADEGVNVPKYSNGTNNPSSLFRSFTANQDHVVRKMYQAPVGLKAYLRVIITDNGPDGLPFQQTLGRHGIEAITERVFWIGVKPEAAEYLLEQVGPERIRSEWVEGDELTAHFAWLGQQEVLPEGRFLVCGQRTEWHERFVSNQGLKPEMLDVIAALVLFAMQANKQWEAPGIKLVEKGIYFTRLEVEQRWSDLTGMNTRKRALRKTLNALAGNPTRPFDREWMHFVSWDTLNAAEVLPKKNQEQIEKREWT